MIWLLLGLALWIAFHLFPVFTPTLRAPLGERFKGVATLGLAAAIYLMWRGWNSDAGFSFIYAPPVWGVHLNNLLMLLAVWLSGAGHMKAGVARVIRHPMLWSVILWAAAHLLVNGNLQDVILFGGLAIWAAISILGLNARDGAWVRPAPQPLKKSLIHVAASLAVFAVIILIHWKVAGVYPLSG